MPPRQEGPAEEEDAFLDCSPPPRSHHRQHASLAQAILGSRLKLGPAHVGQDSPRAGSVEFRWDWVAAEPRGRQPSCGSASRSVFAARKTRPAPATGRGTVPRARLLGEPQANLGRCRGAADRAAGLFLAPL